MRRSILTAPFMPPGPFSFVKSYIPTVGATAVGAGGIVATDTKVYFGWAYNGNTYLSVLDANTQSLLTSFTMPAGYTISSLSVNATTIGALLQSSSANDIFWTVSIPNNAIVGLPTLAYSGGGKLAANRSAGTFCIINAATAQVIDQSGTSVITVTLPATAQGVAACGSYFYIVYSNTSVMILNASTGATVTTVTAGNGSGSIYANDTKVYLPNNSTTLAVSVITDTTVSSLPLGLVSSLYQYGIAVSNSFFYLSYAKGEGGDHIVPIELPSGTVDSSLPELAYFGSFLGVFNGFLYAAGNADSGATSVAVYDSTNANTLVAFKTTSSYISGLAIASGKAFAIGSGSSIDVYTAPTRETQLSGVNIGDPFMGGYYAGIIDTTKGNIIAADASQTGARYALIVAGVSLVNASLYYKTANTAAPAAASTRWDGLTATAAMNSATYPAAQYCAGLAYDDDGASAWYLPAMDELELLYRNLRPDTSGNHVGVETAATFPPTDQDYGYNPSSDPAGDAYTSSSPAQTSAAAFQTGNAQAFHGGYYRTATDYSAIYAWIEYFSSPGDGEQTWSYKNSGNYVRPVRRLVLS